MGIRLTPEEFASMAMLISEITGIALGLDKGYLIETRLSSLAMECGCSTFQDLHSRIRATGDPLLRTKLIDAITTNETLFFRDNSPFEALQCKILPELFDRRLASAVTGLPKNVRIWCAAVSTGQEIYSIAMILRELLPDQTGWIFTLLGTDLSNSAITQASQGVYTDFEVGRGLRSEALRKNFVRNGGGWKVRDEIRAMVTFQRRNLLESFTDLGQFDIIFCRNVAIYFSHADRVSLFNRLADRMNPGGALFLGSSESLPEEIDRFETQHHSRATVYVKRA
ncbi:protein-glutamate O-methyltransferase CheR [Candidatus Sumerlaeota bacterium]|nr:protein-glutamate O-methyltransferase CheR [Candidatus Sumerlaeota bacterium]